MANHNLIGKQGEKLAAEWLIEHQFIIIHKNWRFGRYEVDIIAQKNNRLHFIEVKTRTQTFTQWPEESVTSKKIENLRLAADAFLEKINTEVQLQFDILAVIMNDKPQIYYLQEVF